MYTIEGEWTGYTPAQRRVVYREHTRSKKRIEAIRKISRIRYTDGTYLELRIFTGRRGKAINGCERLIDDCIRFGVSDVDDLPSD